MVKIILRLICFFLLSGLDLRAQTPLYSTASGDNFLLHYPGNMNRCEKGQSITFLADHSITAAAPPITITINGLTAQAIHNTAGANLAANDIRSGQEVTIVYDGVEFQMTSTSGNVLSGAGTGWLTTGNSGTTPGTNFIGTTDVKNLVFKVNNQNAGLIDQTNGNTAIGYQALLNNIFAGNNTAIGNGALNNQSFSNGGVAWSSDNVAIGVNALSNNQPADNINSGNQNIAVGNFALAFNKTGFFNTAIGHYALASNIFGAMNTAIGSYALNSNINGSQNTATGFNALYSSGGSNNTANGYQALYSNGTGVSNLASGYNAGYNNNGSANVFVGDSSGISNTTGSKNTYVGFQAMGSAALTNASAIGYQASVTASNSLVLGGTGASTVNVGIGTTAPGAMFDISGKFQVDNNGNIVKLNSAATNFPNANSFGVLTNNGSGGLTWAVPGASGSAGGDLSGTYPNPTLIKMQGTPLSATAPAAGQVISYNGITFQWEPRTIGTLNGGTANYIPKWASASSLSSTSLLYDNGTNVGIGTSTPASKFAVGGGDIQVENGMGRFKGWFTAGSGLGAEMGVTAGAGFLLTYDRTALSYASTNIVANAALFTVNSNNSFSFTGGNVGIGSNSLTQGKLVVQAPDGSTAFGSQIVSFTGGTAQGQKAVYSFYPTFQATADNAPRKAVDIVGGFNGGAWGNEYLSFNVGSNGVANDAGNLNIERMRIDGAGNVGIGITAPTQVLDVAGNVKFSGALMPNAAAGTAGQLLQSAGVGAAPTWVTATGAGGWTITGNAGTIPGTNFIGTTDAKDFVFNTGGNTAAFERMRITSAGNVGIGTTSPALFLEVASNSGNNFGVSGYGASPSIAGRYAGGTMGAPSTPIAGNGLLCLQGRGYTGAGFSLDQALIKLFASEAWSATANGTYITFSTTANGTTTMSEQMRITNSGNVGIGTLAPVTPLDVRTAVTASAGIGRGVGFVQTLTAAANSDVLTALRIVPTFTNGAFTGVLNYGVQAFIQSANPGSNVGGYFGVSSGATANYGIWTQVGGAAGGTSTQGGRFEAINSLTGNTNYGAYGYVTSTTGIANYALYGEVDPAALPASTHYALGLKEGHIQSVQAVTPTQGAVTILTSASVSAGSTDIKGNITTVGAITGGVTATVLVTFNKSYNSNPIIVVSGANATGGKLGYAITAQTLTTFTVSLTNLTAVTLSAPSFNYIVIE